ncbi:MAG TPA: hypothetical protein VF701_07230 [Thermoanaerobaculia bacterium]
MSLRLSQTSRATYAAFTAIVLWLLIRFLMEGSLRATDLAFGIVFSGVMFAIVYWLSGYRDPA